MNSMPKRTALRLALVAALALIPLLAAADANLDAAAGRLGRAIQFQTISYQDASQVDAAQFKNFQAFLQQAFPLIHKELTREEVGLSLLYTWKGTDPAAKPIILLGHQDVVPIAPGTGQNWTQPPFSGAVAEGFVWGRGTMDCKGIMMGVLEAVEGLLAEGYRPRRTVYLCFGHDEEVGGNQGAVKMAAILKERGVTAEWVVDESGMILDGKLIGIQKPVAVIGIAEKGYLSLELTATAKGGHSSMPERKSAIGALCAAVARVEAHPFPARMGGVSSLTFKALGPEMSPALGFIVKNQWLFRGPLRMFLSRQAATDAMIRTTTAPTIINAGTKENVLPQEARAVINFRLMPGDSIGYVTERVKKIVDDPRVTVKPIGHPREASRVSSIESPGWKTLTGTIGKMFPEVAVAPYLVLGGTDARHYEGISDSVYRFAPMRADEKDQARAHGTDERLGVENYGEMIRFYQAMIKNSD